MPGFYILTRKATTAEVKRRTRRLHDLFRTYHPYADRIGGLVRVLVTETSTDGRYWVGHTKAYEQVLVPKVPEVYGRIILVRIVECDKFHMRSDIVDHGPFDSLVPNNSDSSALELILLKPLVHNRAELSSGDRTVSVKKCTTRTKFDFHKPHWLFHLLLIVLVYAVLKFCESQGYVNFDRLVKSWIG
ncbi:CDK5 regulatory subunit associated protein [Fasciola hepatica]|uniref:CDK5 regulatory subunit associated protein n=1 Tax=Fasciola hepatica TaxID=6192 RepID=A0A4E0RPD2_FASHE|nr:CDK5 regulatory subunit associated protein [Fasciola hepatica]